MPKVVNIYEAKTHLSRLIAEVEAGQEIILARMGKPCARLVPIERTVSVPMGFVEGEVTDAFFEPLPEEELVLWEEGPIFPE